ncbi:MAG: zeta toxin family protein [Paludibacter sp.]|jgi:predicted ABC-type ATPase|nr:zeta toxin family protein [Paludibacter sp.]
MKQLYIIAGCNGAGKTTASYTILPEILSCKEFVNADEIARGLSPFQAEKAAIEAGKIMLERIDELLNKRISFAFETTMATKSFSKTITRAHEAGYSVSILFFWLQTVDLAKQRVKKRVEEGGHNIDEDVIERRYTSGIKNLFKIYFPIADTVLIFDNSEGKHELIFKKTNQDEIAVLNKDKYEQLKTESL